MICFGYLITNFYNDPLDIENVYINDSKRLHFGCALWALMYLSKAVGGDNGGSH